MEIRKKKMEGGGRTEDKYDTKKAEIPLRDADATLHTHTLANRSFTDTTMSETSPTPQRFGQIIRLRRECVDEYVRIHNPIPAEIRACIERCNMHDYSIFYDDGTGLLFASFKYSGQDMGQDMQRMREDEATQAWWRKTDAMQESLSEGSRGSTDEERPWWKPCREVFRLELSKNASPPSMRRRIERTAS